VQRRARREEIPQALAVSLTSSPKLCTQGGVAVGCASVVVESGGAIWLMPGSRGGVCAATGTSFHIRDSWVLLKGGKGLSKWLCFAVAAAKLREKRELERA
jgi:hypothetical protein